MSDLGKTPQKLKDIWRNTIKNEATIQHMETEIINARLALQSKGRGLLRGYRRLKSTDKTNTMNLLREDMIRRDILQLNPPVTDFKSLSIRSPYHTTFTKTMALPSLNSTQ